MKYAIVVIVTVLFSLGWCTHFNPDTYPFSTVLKADSSGNPWYTLYWNYSNADWTIKFAVKVDTEGWVGFGVSPNGTMIGSDVIIGWVNDQGMAFLHDRYAPERGLPKVDPWQDWILTNGTYEDGHTILEFWRKWVTCDDDWDIDIDANTAHIIFSWNDNDPINDNIDGPMYHGMNRNTVTLNLLGGLVNPPTEITGNTIQNFSIIVNNIEVPTKNTTYWCATQELPMEVRTNEKYIIKHEPWITSNNLQFVKYIAVYLCDVLNDNETSLSMPCNDLGESAKKCLSGEVIAAWGIGGNSFVYPKDVALPIGGSDSAGHVMIQIHYDNSMSVPDIWDDSGIVFYFINESRPYEAGILRVGHDVTELMIVPPNTPSYTIYGVCTDKCTSKFLPEKGIRIFANLLHTHQTGREVTLKLIRHTQQCGGYEEWPVNGNSRYNSSYQQFNILLNEVTVLPGDVLLLDCTYNTAGKNKVILGGYGTQEEKCISFPVYYPRVSMTTCSSYPTIDSLVEFAQKHSQSVEVVAALRTAYQSHDPWAFGSALNEYIDWSHQAVDDLQWYMKEGNVTSWCSATQSPLVQDNLHSLSEITCPYEAPDTCADQPSNIMIGEAAHLIGSILLMITCFVFTWTLF